MRTEIRVTLAALTCASLCIVPAVAQRGGGEWTTSNGDAQRSSWVRTDPKISKDKLGGFKFLWKLRLDEAKQVNDLTQPVLVNNIIGYKGFKALAFVGSGSDTVYSVDYDLGRMYWTAKVGASKQAATANCPGGVTSALSRATPVAAGGRGAGFGGGGGRGGLFGVAGFGAPSSVAALGSDGKVYYLNLQNGAQTIPPVQFVPPGARAHGLVLVNSMVYTTTGHGCGGAPNALWGLDLASESKKVLSWNSGADFAGSAGPALGTDGRVFVATADGPADAASQKYGRTVAALDPATLELKDWFMQTSGKGFGTSPVIFPFKDKELIAAGSKDGRLYLLDSSSLGGSDHKTPLFQSAAIVNDKGDVADLGLNGALSSFEEPAGTRWVLAPASGPLAADLKFPTTNGEVKNGSIAAFKVVEQGGKPGLEPMWVSRDLVSPQPPVTVNGVVFALSGGSSGRGKPANAVLYALDASTGKELWNSGTTITSFVKGGGLAAGGSQIYLGTVDGTLYTFGFFMEH